MIGVGTKFRYQLADANPLWRVTRRVRPGVWDAVCVNEPFEFDGRSYDSDFAGQVRRFTEEDITAALRHTALWDGLRDDHDRFWAGTQIGEVLHYHHGFGAYVRGVVVNHNGKKCLQPTALVGDWQEYDLPSRSETGEVRYSSGGRFFDSDPWQPSPTCMFEHPSFSAPHGRGQCNDPTGLDPIDLTIPTPTAEEAERERLHRLRVELASLLTDSRADIHAQLARAADLLKESL